MKLFTKQKQIHRPREQTSGYQRKEGCRRDGEVFVIGDIN